MPRQGDLEVIRHIKAVNPDQAVILNTGCIEEFIEQQVHNQGTGPDHHPLAKHGEQTWTYSLLLRDT